MRGDTAFAETCDTEAARLQANIEAQAWDGGWYRRAYFDNGEPLGSAANLECQIDALPRAAKDPIYRRMWDVLSGHENADRYRSALSLSDRQAIVEILRDTKKDLPSYFQKVTR